jgi:hypothetical protein
MARKVNALVGKLQRSNQNYDAFYLKEDTRKELLFRNLKFNLFWPDKYGLKFPFGRRNKHRLKSTLALKS